MIAAFLELDGGVASVAALPSILAGALVKPVCVDIAGTGTRVVPSTVAGRAHLGLAATAFGLFFAAKVLGPNPLTTAAGRAVDAIPC